MFRIFCGTGKAATRGREQQQLPTFPTSYSDECKTLVERAFEHTQALMSAHEGIWRLSEATSWYVDMAAGTITFPFKDKIVCAPAQLIGSWYNDAFLWGWDHPSAKPGTAIAATKVKAYADQQNITELQNRKTAISFDDGWKLASIAVLLGDLQGLYRFEAGPGNWAYVGFGTISLRKLDFSTIDSYEKANELHQKGELAALYLFPLEFGGLENRLNQVFVPPHVVMIKNSIDKQIFDRCDDGTNYSVSPIYNGNSVIPSALVVEAAGVGVGGPIQERIDIW